MDVFINIFVRYIFVKCLIINHHLIKYLDLFIQVVLGIITRGLYCLFNISDHDFNIETTVDQLFKQNSNNYNPDIHDTFHIYLSKLLYETSDQIIDQCMNWGFNEKSIDILGYIQPKDIKQYPYSTQAVVINHAESNTIIIAFRGIQPMGLLKWMNDTSTNFIDINNVFNDNHVNPIRVHAGFYYALGLSEFNPLQPINFNLEDEVLRPSPSDIMI
jgi:hypothetical protein